MTRPTNQQVNEKIKAVALVSGGLDSSLAVRLIQNQGIEVIALHINIGFSQAAFRKIVPAPKKQVLQSHNGMDTLENSGIDIVQIEAQEAFLREVLLSPEYGYGKGINPCLDCKIFMQKTAWEYARNIGAKFLVTGEVLGQRPMSQHRGALQKIENAAGTSGRVLRPLSALCLTPSMAEQARWVNRSELLNIKGRSRKRQITLAASLGIKSFETPAGGCFLTEKHFAHLSRDIILHQKNTVHPRDFNLLKAGYHFRINPDLKLIVGRNHFENEYFRSMLPHLTENYIGLEAPELAGPFSLICGSWDTDSLTLAGRIHIGYIRDTQICKLNIIRNSGEISISPLWDAMPRTASKKYLLSEGNDGNTE